MGRGASSDLIRQAARLLRVSAALRLSLLGWSAVGLLSAGGLTAYVVELHGADAAVPAAAAMMTWWLVVITVLAVGAPLLRTPEGTRLDHYGVPNGLTAIRAWFCVPLLLCAFLPLPGETGLALWCVVGGSVAFLDAVDGYIARRVGPITDLGKALDPAMDSLFFSMAAIGSLPFGLLPRWVAGLMLLRYLGPLVLTPIVFALGRRPELVHTTWGRRNTALTGATVFILMWVRILHGPVDAVGSVLGAVFLLPTTGLHARDLWLRTVRAA